MGKGIFRYNKDIWVEKYRPITLDDYIASSELKERFKDFIAQQNIPHLLFAGPPGVGKSSIANLLVRNLQCDSLYINAAEERGIDTVRDKIMKFCITSSFEPLKIVVLDEFSETTVDAQNSLKAVLEQYSQQTRFIFTANHIENIVDAIRSRCQEFDVLGPTKEQIQERCKTILEKEEVDYEEDELKEIIRHNFPDIRKIIQYLDQQSVGKVLKLDKEFFKVLKYENKVIDILKKTTASNMFDKANEVRQLIADTRVRNFVSLYKFLYEKVDDFAPKNKVVPTIFRIHEGLKSDNLIADKEMNLVSTVLKIMEVIVS